MSDPPVRIIEKREGYSIRTLISEGVAPCADRGRIPSNVELTSGVMSRLCPDHDAPSIREIFAGLRQANEVP